MNFLTKTTSTTVSIKTAVVLFCVMLFSGRIFAQQIVEPEMVFVGGGTFTMGCTFEQGSDCSSDEKPSHEVQLTGFAISKYEVTQALWKSVMGNNPSRFKGDSLPVENVSWDEVQIFIQRLNAKTGKTYRLPTEAEWEYAARGGNKSQQAQFAGGFELENIAWCNTNSNNTTHNVGTRQPNELGLYDMSGNVWEWCSDIYGPYSSELQNNPTGAKKGTARILRGGCYAAIGKQCRVASRKNLYQGGKDYMTGFRLALDDDREAQAAAAAEKARIEAEKAAEQQRLTQEKAAADAAKKAEQERLAAEKAAEQERIAQEKAVADAAKKAEQERLAAEKAAEQERLAQEKAAADAAKKAEQERLAAEKAAEQERLAAEKAAADAAKKAEQERLAAEKAAEQERKAQEKAAADAAKKAEQERIAAEKAAEQKALQEEHDRKVQHRKDSIAAIPTNTFFTLNAACTGTPDLTYGFKVGQVKVAGWYFSAMSSFHFKGAFSSFKSGEHYLLSGDQKVAKMSAAIGLVVRPSKPLSIHIGAGYTYRTLTMETDDGWHSFYKRTYHGVDAVFGFMFHMKGFVLSAEAAYTTFDFNYDMVDPMNRLEGRVGIGICLPNKKKSHN